MNKSEAQFLVRAQPMTAVLVIVALLLYEAPVMYLMLTEETITMGLVAMFIWGNIIFGLSMWLGYSTLKARRMMRSFERERERVGP